MGYPYSYTSGFSNLSELGAQSVRDWVDEASFNQPRG